MQKIGRYEIRDKLGKGAMGGVVRAYDPTMRREVAIKILHRHFSDNNKVRTRFLREVSTIARLNHPAIVAVHDSGIDNGRAYLVMQLMEGGNLADHIRRTRQPLSAEAIQLVVDRVGGALDAVHQSNLVHRDVKPENILYDKDGLPYLADFGIVRLSESDSKFTTVDTIIGTPAYMSPEQASGGKQIDGRSDLYSLGIVLFEMLTGRVPFEGDATRGTAVKHIVETIPDIRKYNQQLPRHWRKLNEKALAKEPKDRFQSGYELATAVRQAFEKRGLMLSHQRMLAVIGGGIAILLMAFMFAAMFSPSDPNENVVVDVTQQYRMAQLQTAEAESNQRIGTLEALLTVGEDDGSINTQLTAEAAAQAEMAAQATTNVEMATAQAVSSEQVDLAADCTRPENYALSIFDPVFDPPRGTVLETDQGIFPTVTYPIVITGACPIEIGRLISLKGGGDRIPILRNENGEQVETLANGEQGGIEVVFDSAVEVATFDDEWVLSLVDPDGFLIELPEEQAQTLKLFINAALGEVWLVRAARTTATASPTIAIAAVVTTPTPRRTNTPTRRPATATPNFAATTTVQAQQANAANFRATQTAQARQANAANVNATQTAQAQRSRATQTALAQQANAANFNATQTAQAQQNRATQTAQAQQAAAWNATQTAQARNGQATQTAQAQQAANFNATQTAQAVRPTNTPVPSAATSTPQPTATPAPAPIALKSNTTGNPGKWGTNSEIKLEWQISGDASGDFRIIMLPNSRISTTIIPVGGGSFEGRFSASHINGGAVGEYSYRVDLYRNNQLVARSPVGKFIIENHDNPSVPPICDPKVQEC